ncbi:MAG: cytidylate kinase family protein [Acidobacteriaceae bacterium]|nr:cytidylate kinase family protein [Acidobacteriaceae bacterium]
MRIITIEREYGCGAPAISGKLGSCLGWKVWDRALTEEVARIAQVMINTAMGDELVISTVLHAMSALDANRSTAELISIDATR